MTGDGLRVGLAGATGALGREVAQVLEALRFPLRELVPFASEGSPADDVEILGEVYEVVGGMPPLRHLDLLLLCCPPAEALTLVREALRAEVPCVDCSGALAGSPEVPLVLASVGGVGAARGAPAVSSPAGPVLGWAPVLAAIHPVAGVRRVAATVLRSVGRVGRRGLEVLSNETIALLSQRDSEPSDLFPAQVAFDCSPLRPGVEIALARDLGRLLDASAPIGVAASEIQVPTFVGDGSSLVIGTERTVPLDEIRSALDKAVGVERVDAVDSGASTRDATGREESLVSGLREDPTREGGIQLWIAADTLRQAAVNAVRIAEARLPLH